MVQAQPKAKPLTILYKWVPDIFWSWGMARCDAQHKSLSCASRSKEDVEISTISLDTSVCDRAAFVSFLTSLTSSQDKRLIIMLSNCSHTLEIVVPRIIENLTKHGYVEMEKALKVHRRINNITLCFNINY